MRILHWTDDYLPQIGGAETFVRDLATEQQAMGHEVAVSAMALAGSPSREEMNGIQVHRHPASHAEVQRQPGMMARILRSSLELQQSFRPEIVHIHGHVPVPWLHLIKRPIPPSPSILTVHTPLEHSDKDRYLLCQMVDQIVTVSQSVRRCLPSRFMELEHKTTVILNGARWPETEARPPDRQRPVVLALGRIIEEKGFDTAIKALAHTSDARLVLAGDGNKLGSLRQLAGELGVSERVDFKGWVHPDDVPALLNECTMVVVPSRLQEAFGLVAVQAGQMGRPTIASQVGGLPEIIQDGITGLLVPPDDPQALAEAMMKLLTHPKEAEEMGRAAQERVQKHFSITRCAVEYQALYHQVIEPPLKA